ncbi:MAG: glutamate 5-kinase [Chloroflexi bacterium]|nr:glutamate 5-kinase [Chloroflexota bacterium]MDA1226725.1 glutamate 5-kinase [Chloroflexota bacterium]
MSAQRQTASTDDPGSHRRSHTSYQRIVVKVGTSLLTGGTGRLDPAIMAGLVGQIAALHSQGKQMLLVSSGAVAAGRHALGITQEDKDLPLRQVLAAVGQSHLMHAYEELFAAHDISVAQALLSRRDLTDRLGYLNIRNTLEGLLERKVVPIINENDVVAVEELAGEAFGDNDTLSALVANLVDSDMLVMLGEVEGLYTADPFMDSSACHIPVVEQLTEEDVERLGGPSWGSRGRGGMKTKLGAARLATASGVDVVIAGGRIPGVIEGLAAGKSAGTYFPTSTTKLESRKRWMLSGVSTRGEIVVDSGAVRALRINNRSLLPAGVTSVKGTFERGDIVSILDSDGSQMACGISNYGSDDLSAIKGEHSHRISEILGHHYGDDVVHRDNMVIV